MYENINVDINLVFFIQGYKVIFKVLLDISASVIFILLALIKLFHKTAAEYLRDLIPKLLFYLRDEDAPFGNITSDMRIYVTV